MHLPDDLERRLGPREEGIAVASDGMRLRWQTFGRGRAVVFANGIGVRFAGAAAQVEALRDRYRFVCWDYRGMGAVPPADPDDDVSMARHARDAMAVLDDLGIARAAFVGWSMGVQVGLEAIRLDPDRVAGLVALLGTYGLPFRTAFPRPVGETVEGIFAAAARVPRVPQALLDLAVALPNVAFAVLSRIGFVGRDADRSIFDADVRSVAEADRRTYLRTMLSLAAHDASDLLPRVRCPTLVICGDRDRLTPPKVARHMADEIPGAIYREIPGGTHFALIQYPALVNAWLDEFLSSLPAWS